ncbi:thymidine kinase [Tubulinosema ratisbonensis]|uniref:Thymidine kinase n=1 Tax=Tubulinosema ratisbonensis TaxID=291195 RepID=A0A437APC6_9MICR|nr:thymidine kinase [Tubulinosema ratisbonensis]
MPQLIFRYGTMCSGKSMQLISLATQYNLQNKKILILKPAIDTRFSDTEIVSRNDLRIKVDYLITSDFDITSICELNKVSCILVDEAQFLKEKHVEQLRMISFKTKVICYGLLTDFQSKLFEGSKRLVELADSKEEIFSICHYCNGTSKLNIRHVNNHAVFTGEVIQLGGEEAYYQTCVVCYFRIKNKNCKNEELDR